MSIFGLALFIITNCGFFASAGSPSINLVFLTRYMIASGGASGLEQYVFGVLASGNEIYARTQTGISISRDGGNSWSAYTSDDGLAGEYMQDLFVDGHAIYAGTNSGLSISRDDAATWMNYTAAEGLCGDYISAVYADGSTIYAGTNGKGFSISKDGGITWTTHSRGNIQQDGVLDIYAKGSTVILATAGGVLVSEDGGSTWNLSLEANGLGDNEVHSLFVDGSIIYAGTYRGLSISKNGGKSWTNTLPHYVNKLQPGWHDTVSSIYASGSVIFAGGNDLAISTDGGRNWKDFPDQLGDTSILSISVDGSTMYVGTNAGIFVFRME
ncbi:MAG: hypothetical protein WBM17_00430 [Anaerolineales bacterium]